MLLISAADRLPGDSIAADALLPGGSSEGACSLHPFGCSLAGEIPHVEELNEPSALLSAALPPGLFSTLLPMSAGNS